MSRSLVLLARVASLAPLALVIVSLLMSGVAAADPCPSSDHGGC